MAKGSNMMAKVGSWAFIIGVIVAILAGFFQSVNMPVVIWSLVILGLIVGFLNVTAKETTPFLLATVSLVIVTSFGGNQLAAIKYIGQIFTAIMIFVIPAAMIVALKAIYALAADE